MPPDYLYKVVQFESVENQANHFKTTLRINIQNEHQAQEWLNKFSKNNKCNFTVKRNKSVGGRYFVFNRDLKCHHNVSGGVLGQRKHCGCPMTLKLTVAALPKQKKCNMPRERRFCGDLRLDWSHNHPIRAADVLRRRPVSKETQDKLISMFNIGHSPSTALHLLKMDLRVF